MPRREVTKQLAYLGIAPLELSNRMDANGIGNFAGSPNKSFDMCRGSGGPMRSANWNAAVGFAERGSERTSQALEMFKATAARIRDVKAFSLTLSPSRKSMARLVPPSRLELKRPSGSSSEAPLENVSFTALL